jgi:ribosomal protein L37AE/L43A
LFKETKSYAQLRAFRTANPHIAEGLIWAAVAAATIQRFMAHLAQRVHAVEISTQKTAKAANAALTDLFKALAIARISCIQKAFKAALNYLATNAQRAHPRRDRHSGRLQTGLKSLGVEAAYVPTYEPGLSLPTFLERYGTEAQCRDALFNRRWPDGFVCPECTNATGCMLIRGVYQCHRCHHQTSMTAGTIFHATKLPLRLWFLAIYLLTQRKKSLSALQLSRDLGVSYNTAWKLKHNILQVMLERCDDRCLSGRIEIDDAYLGGERSGKRGRGAAGKFPFIAAVETSADGRPLSVQLRRVPGFTRAAIERYARHAIAPASHIVSDGLACFRVFDQPLYTHERIISGGGRSSVENPAFHWVNTVLGNVKNAITGSLQAIRGMHAPRYLAEFEYRFNRRFDLPAMIERFTYVAMRTPPMPYRLLKMAESYT